MRGPGADVRLAVEAPAKINLFLHVTGRRADGYHLLESLVAFASVGDALTAAPSDELVFEVDGPFAEPLLSAGGDNLVIRAARALCAACGHERGAWLHLVKRLPVASGIGGGSADAAAALRLLARLWEVEMPETELDRIALTLGADVPVCLGGLPALMSGIGEEVSPVPALGECGVVLANAGIPVPTPDVFRARTGPYSAPSSWIPPVDFEGLIEELFHRRNDLTAAAISVSPAVGTVLGARGATAGSRLARLSGSGGTCFALYADRAAAAEAALSISADYPGWWVVAGSFRRTPPDISFG
ncbi:MAG: 4-(cytidine 5'-diphospho)-2-C-methyl-D-erythritol kinase [Rhodospirillaceae bacterium]